MPLRWGLALTVALCAVAAASVVFGFGGDVSLVGPAILAVLCWLTAVMTRRSPPALAVARGRALWLQLAGCAVAMVATGLEGARLNGVMPPGFQVPVWSAVHDAIRYTAAFGMFGNGVANLVLYCLPLGIVLTALSVPVRDLGLGPFRRRAAASAVIWLVPPAAVCAVLLVTGVVGAGPLGAQLLKNVLNNGFSEEFLFRGMIFGRLRAVMGDGAALVTQAVLFALWHFGTDWQSTGGSVPGTIAEMVSVQLTLGLALGYVTLRTGNVAVGSAFHVFFDTLGSMVL